MTAAIEGRNTKRRNADRVSHPVNPGTTIYAGTLIALLTAGGNAVPGGTAASGSAVGVAEETVVGNGTNRVEATRGSAFQFANSAAADLITRADIGNTAFIVDDQTVAKTDNSAARKAAGKIIDVDAGGVWVLVG
ncbi:hypothetical protein JWH04_20590 [Xanthomonas melonis]|uniref:hypothetical protein n=1 Tax=Xanthomonas melonis TaxID=56456 RepID=UPI001E5FF8AE|nr:hypothetical protein [Xanthomonas melonis]MCD0281308.1 hypothetical protein [Xanthomonas melonis]